MQCLYRLLANKHKIAQPPTGERVHADHARRRAEGRGHLLDRKLHATNSTKSITHNQCLRERSACGRDVRRE